LPPVSGYKVYHPPKIRVNEGGPPGPEAPRPGRRTAPLLHPFSLHACFHGRTNEESLFSRLCQTLVEEGPLLTSAVYTLDPEENHLVLRFVTDRNMPRILLSMVRVFSLNPDHADRSTLSIRAFTARKPLLQNDLAGFCRKK